jgi:hypothetical protein
LWHKNSSTETLKNRATPAKQAYSEGRATGRFAVVAIDDALDISASLEQVWSIATDFHHYKQWNPFITQAKGNLKEKERIELHMKPFHDKDRVLSAKILLVKTPTELQWVSSLGPGLRWDHTLHVEDFHEGHVCIVQRAVFTGMLVNRYKDRLQQHLGSGLSAMNHAIKVRAEAGAPSGSTARY